MYNENIPTILLVDDSDFIHKLLAQRLRKEDIRLLSAESGIDGLRMARSRDPDLILLDLNMPVMDGFEVLRALKEDPNTMDIPVIVLSGSSESDDKVTGLDLGAVDYICKPFDMAELRARVRSALRIRELMQMLAQRAQIDGLTALWNRAYFDEQLAAEVASAERSGRPLSVVMCDLDNFKRLNDTYGHLAGDEVIRKFAQLLTRELRVNDIACRYGGEEFALIMRDTDTELAAAAIDRIRGILEQQVWARHPERNITASFGVTDKVKCGGSSPASWVEAADEALYEAKEGGRNRVVVYQLHEGGDVQLHASESMDSFTLEGDMEAPASVVKDENERKARKAG